MGNLHMIIRLKKVLNNKLRLSLGFVLGCLTLITSYGAIIYREYNSMELIKVLLYYKFWDYNTQKHDAAQYLAQNMKYHYSRGRLISNTAGLELWRKNTDSIFYENVSGYWLHNYPSDSLRVLQKQRRILMDTLHIPDAIIDMSIIKDSEIMSFDFLTEHIDHAFRVWNENKFANKLSYEEFKEYILPYKSVNGYGFLETNQKFEELFGKYINICDSNNVASVVEYYNKTINGLRDLNGKTNRTVLAGFYDLYSRDFHDCIDIASYGCNILRACGIPAMVEYNVSYKEWTDRHYHCSIYNSKSKNWECFNPESSIPNDGRWSWEQTTNIHRMTYGAQENTPYFLRAEGEYVPYEMSSPCIKDVTDIYKKTTKVTLPIVGVTKNNLAYLASYNFNSKGIIPLTWGMIDPKQGKVTFNKVLYNVLYFPIYYPSNNFETFGKPFYIIKNGDIDKICSIPYTDDSAAKYDSLILTRKFPRKENMKKIAEGLVGGRFIGANKKDFSDAVILYEITESPLPHFRDYKFTRTGFFKYYRFQAPERYPHANISRLEWITYASYKYKNTATPSSKHILYPGEEKGQDEERSVVKLLDEDTWDEMKWKAEYDGNMQTAPSAYSNITLRLKTPQVVTGVRMAPLNADNGIKAGHVYALYYWDNGWQLSGRQIAKYEYLIYKKIPKNKIYLLHNETEGKEELPFVIKNGMQLFIYHDII